MLTTVLFTCSAFGKAIESARNEVDIPVLNPNEAMLDEALVAGGRIGLLTTFEPSVSSIMVDELEALARERGQVISVETRVVPGALTALKRDCVEEHDAAIAAAAKEYDEVDVLMLAQFSMASALDRIVEVSGPRVLTSPSSAVRRLKALLC